MRPPPCLAGTPFVVDRPPTHFFVKKKFIPIGGTKSTTQKVPSVFCYARDFLCRVKRCATHGIPQSGIPPGGGITAMPHTFRRNVWERGPPSDQRDDGGGRIPLGAQIPPSAHTDRKHYPSLCRNPSAAQGSTSHAGGSFFLYEKSVLRESDCLRGRKPKVCTDLTPPLFPPLKRRESKGGQAPLAERETGSRGLALGPHPLFQLERDWSIQERTSI